MTEAGDRRARVAICRVDGGAASARDAVHRAVRDAMESVSFETLLPRGRPIAIKPNLGFDHFLPGAVTGPWVLEAVLGLLREHEPDLVVVEADQVVVRAERAWELSGARAVCDRLGVAMVNLGRQPHQVVELPGARVLGRVALPRLLLQRTLVTVPVVKTHNKTVLSGAIKNQWGCLPTLRHNFHPVLDDTLADLGRLLRPALAIVDGTVGLEGDGPKSGRPRVFDRVLAGADPVAVDATIARLLGYDPAAIPHLVRAAEVGLGVLDARRIEIVGDAPIEPFPGVVRARHNPVSFAEIVLRRSFARRLVFETPLLALCCFAARRWYDLWYALVGRRRAAEILATRYGAAWTK